MVPLGPCDLKRCNNIIIVTLLNARLFVNFFCRYPNCTAVNKSSLKNSLHLNHVAMLPIIFITAKSTFFNNNDCGVLMVTITFEQKLNWIGSYHIDLAIFDLPGLYWVSCLSLISHSHLFICCHSLAAWNHIKYHSESTKTHHFKIKNSKKNFSLPNPSIFPPKSQSLGKTQLYSYTILSTNQEATAPFIFTCNKTHNYLTNAD